MGRPQTVSKRSGKASRRNRQTRGTPLRPAVEALDRRVLLSATLWVDNTPAGVGGTDFTASGGTQPAIVPGLVPGVTIFPSISAAIAAATAGDTINVSDGTYNELAAVNKTLTLRGNQVGVDARTRGAVPETIVSNGDGDFQILANNVSIDGFKLTGVVNNQNVFPGALGAAIWTNPGFSGTNGGHQIYNNIIDGNINGIELDNVGAFQTVVQRNLIQNNNAPGAGSGNGIAVNFGLSNALIDNNKFVNNPNGSASLFIGGPSITVTNNAADSQIYLASATSGSISGNTITASTSGGIVLGGGNSSLSITNNEVNGVAAGGFGAFRLRNDGPGPNSGLTVTGNKFIGGAGAYGVRPGAGSYTGTLTLTDNQISGGAAAIQNDDAALSIDASENYWGTSDPAAVSASILGAGAANVDFTPLIDNGDTAPATVGFQADHSSLTVHTLGAQTGSTGRIQEGVNLVTVGGTVHVAAGTYIENVTVPKKVTLLGNQSGVDARTRAGAESIVDNATNSGKTGFTVSANDVAIDGFTVQGSTSSNVFGPAIFLSPGTSGSQVLNNIIQTSYSGLFVANANAADQTVVRHNLFRDNSAGLNTDIYADEFTAGVGGLNNVLIDANSFTNSSPTEASWALGISNTGATPFTNITFSNNSVTNHGRGAYFYSTTGASIAGNDFLNLVGAHYAIGLFDNDHNFSITGNRIDGGYDGIQVADDFGNPNSGVAANLNAFVNLTNASIEYLNEGGTAYTGTFDASANYWGTSNPATVAASIKSDPGPAPVVDFTPLLDNNESVANQSVVGFQADLSSVTVHTLGAQTGAAGRIQEGVNVVSTDGTVHVAAGTYTENVTINKAVTVLGAVDGLGHAAVTLQPAVSSNSLVDLSGTSFGGSNNVTLKNILYRGNNGAIQANNGVLVPTSAQFGTLTIDNSDFQDFQDIGISVNGNAVTGISAQNLVVSNSSFSHNGSFGNGGDGDIDAFTYNGNASLSHLTLVGSSVGNTGTRLGIQFRGAGNAGTGAGQLPSGTVSFNDIDISGTYRTQFIGIQDYTNVSTMSFTDVRLGGASSGITGNFGAALRFDGVGLTAGNSTVNLGNTYFRANTVGGAIPAPGMGIEFAPDNTYAFLRADATNTHWDTTAHVNATAGSLTLAELFEVEDRVLHYPDALNGGQPQKGFAEVRANNAYVTATFPGSSIQRAVDVVSSPGTVNIKTGAYTGNVDATAAGRAITLAPGSSPGQVTINGNLALNGNDALAEELNGTVAGTGYDQLIVNGTVDLGGATLDRSLGFAPSAGDTFVIISNDGADAVTGTFAGLPEGAFFALGGQTFQITYQGGDGNDVVLRALAPAAINLVKQTNFTDNNTAPGPFVPVGSTVTFFYIVTNPGGVPLSGVTVRDDNGTPGNLGDDFNATFTGGDANANGQLDTSETWNFTASRIATPGQYTNTGTATGTPPPVAGPAVSDTDVDNHFGAAPAISLVKLTNGTNNNSAPGPIVPVGSTVTFTYIVTNPGNVPLSGVLVRDNNGTPGNLGDDFNANFVGGDANANGLLDTSETWTFTASRIATPGQYTNTGTATGTPPPGAGPATTASDVDNHYGNSAPIANNDFANASENAIIIGNVLANDTDPDPATAMSVLSVTVNGVTTPVAPAGTTNFAGLHGAFTIRADGNFSYDNDGSDATTDGFTYTVSDDGTTNPGHTATANLSVSIFNVVPLVTTAGGGTSGPPGSPISGRTYTFSDPGLEGTWNVSFDFGDGTPLVTETRNAPGTYPVPAHTYATAGIKTVTVSVGDGESVGTTTYQVNVGVAPSPFMVTNFQGTPSGFNVTFTTTFNGSVLNLYGANPDVIVTDPAGQKVRGSLVWDNGSSTLSFVASGAYEPGANPGDPPFKTGILPAGTYNVALISGANAFNDGQGNNLNGGTGDLVAGGDYTTTFNPGTPAARIVSIDDFARGPGQQVKITNDTGTGIPVNFSDRSGIASFDITISYDASLLNITGIDVPAGWFFSPSQPLNTLPTTGRVTLGISAAGPAAAAGSGFGPLATLLASVRPGAAYGDSQLIDLEVQSLEDSGAHTITATADDAVHSVNYVGDASANQLYSSTDATLILAQSSANNANPGLYSNFTAYPNTDATVVADTNNNSVLTSSDATNVLAEVSGIQNNNPGSPLIPGIPPLPAISGKTAKPAVSESSLVSTVLGNYSTSTNWSRLSDELKRSTKLDSNGVPKGLFSATPIRPRIVPNRG